MKKLAILTALLLALALPAGAAVRIVHIVDTGPGTYAFTPFTVFAALGDTIRWVNETSTTHTATGGQGGPNPVQDVNSPINSSLLGPAGTYDVQMTNMGPLTYFCSVHSEMTGIVRVTTLNISVQEYSFTPSTASVGVGDTVIWTNKGTVIHTTTSGADFTADGTWNSGNKGPGGTFKYVAKTSGAFPYFCSIHGATLGMTGELDVAEATGVAPGGAVGRTRLLAARPNPARRSVELPFELAQSSGVRLVVLDAAGRRVAGLMDGVLAPGRHSAVWNGRTSSGRIAAGGVYYYRLTAGSFASTRRFTWLR